MEGVGGWEGMSMEGELWVEENGIWVGNVIGNGMGYRGLEAAERG